ncbi:hypothetical protein D3C78_959600 [compost metagenome]
MFGLHFTLGLYIRNNYVLSDLIQVPNLIHEFKILNNIATNYDDIDEELRWGYEYFDNLNVNDDDISYSIVKLVWEKLRK